MDRSADIRQRMTRVFDLPGDMLLDVPRIVMMGSLQVTVENHRGLLEYNRERVTVAIAGGSLVIEGSGLDIGAITAEEVTVSGTIAGLRYGA